MWGKGKKREEGGGGEWRRLDLLDFGLRDRRDGVGME